MKRQFARLAAEKAAQRIAMIDPTKLSIKEATLLLKLGLQEERAALGLADATVIKNQEDAESGMP
jgi:hypothetical protein